MKNFNNAKYACYSNFMKNQIEEKIKKTFGYDLFVFTFWRMGNLNIHPHSIFLYKKILDQLQEEIDKL